MPTVLNCKHCEANIKAFKMKEMEQEVERVSHKT